MLTLEPFIAVLLINATDVCSMPGNTPVSPSTKWSTTSYALFTTLRFVTSAFRSKRTCSRPCGSGPTRIPSDTSSTTSSRPSPSEQARTTSSARTRNLVARVTGLPGPAPSERSATARSGGACGTRCRRATSVRWRVATAGRKISTCRTLLLLQAPRSPRGRRPPRGDTATATAPTSHRRLVVLRMSTCARRPSRLNNTVGPRRRHRASITRLDHRSRTVRVLLDHMDNHLRACTDRDRPLRDTGVVRPRQGPGIRVEGMALVAQDRTGSLLDRMDNPRLAGVGMGLSIE